MKQLAFALFLLITMQTLIFAEDMKEIQKPNSAPSLEMDKGISSSITDFFARLGMAPIIMPMAERVGDILEVSRDRATFIAGADECFPGIIPREEPTQLPSFNAESEKVLVAALGVGHIAEASAEIRGGQNFFIEYRDAKVRKVNVSQLRTALAKLRRHVQECDRAKIFLNLVSRGGASSAKMRKDGIIEVTTTKNRFVSDKAPPLLIGTVIYARRTIHVTVSDNISGAAAVSIGEELLKKLGFSSNFKVDTDARIKSFKTVALVGTEVVPVALAPAYSISEKSKNADGATEYEITSLDDSTLRTKIRYARKTQDKSYKDILKVIVTKSKNMPEFAVNKFVIKPELDPSQFIIMSNPYTWEVYTTDTRSAAQHAKPLNFTNKAVILYEVLHGGNT